MNVALSELPRFHRAAGHGSGRSPHRRHHHRAERSPTWSGPISMRARHGWSREPIVEMLIPSTLDDTPGAAGPARGQPVLPARRAGAAGRALAGTTHRETVADLMIDTVDALRAGLQGGACSGGRSLTPAGSRAHLRPGRRRHLPRRAGAGSAVQRPADAGPRRLSGTVGGLYMCGSGTHPGGGVTGAPGHNAARAILADSGRHRFAGLTR